jgi:DNA mismatch repair protein MutS
VIERAREVLKRHEQSEHALSETLSPGALDDESTNPASASTGAVSPPHRRNGHQEVLFTALDRAVLDKLRESDLDQLKPIDALNLLAELKKQIS